MIPQISANTSVLARSPSIVFILSAYLPTTASTLLWCTFRRFSAFSSVSSDRCVRRSRCRPGAERHVVDLARLGVQTAPDDALDELLVGHVEEQEGVGLDALLGDGVRLRRRRGDAPSRSHPFSFGVGGVERIHHHSDRA